MNEQDILLAGITRIALQVVSWSGRDDVQELKGIRNEIKKICFETINEVGAELDRRSRRLFKHVPAKKC